MIPLPLLPLKYPFSHGANCPQQRLCRSLAGWEKTRLHWLWLEKTLKRKKSSVGTLPPIPQRPRLRGKVKA